MGVKECLKTCVTSGGSSLSLFVKSSNLLLTLIDVYATKIHAGCTYENLIRSRRKITRSFQGRPRENTSGEFRIFQNVLWGGG